MSENLKPVWIAFPKIPWGSIGWRMGPGEDYWRLWVQWFNALCQGEREMYKNLWSEPEGWEDFYSFIETGALPRWIREQQQKVAEAELPPQPGEVEIRGYHRVLWLIRHHFKRLETDHMKEDECLAEVYAAPDGAKWRLSAHATQGGMRFKKLHNDDA